MSKRHLLFTLLIIGILLSGCVATEVGPSVDNVQRAEALIDQGTALLRRGALAEARASFEISYDLQPSAASLDGLGCVAFLLGNIQQARDYFIGAYTFDPEYQQSLSNLALLYDYLGAKEEARALYARAVAKVPAHAEGRNNLGVLLKEMNQPLQARDELYRAYVVHPHEILGSNLERVGEKPWQE